MLISDSWMMTLIKELVCGLKAYISSNVVIPPNSIWLSSSRCVIIYFHFLLIITIFNIFEYSHDFRTFWILGYEGTIWMFCSRNILTGMLLCYVSLNRMTVWLSTAPTEPLTHWYQVRCLLQSPLFAKAGDTMSGTALLIANKRWAPRMLCVLTL